MNKTNNQNDDHSNVAGCLAVAIGIASFALFHPAIAILICLILIAVAYKYNKEKKIQQVGKQQERKLRLIEKYGTENGELIFLKIVKLGMTKEMVIEAIGNPESSKRIEKTNSIKEKCLWTLQYKTFEGMYGKKYGVFENNILIEYGDR